jgi:hypothetical protein
MHQLKDLREAQHCLVGDTLGRQQPKTDAKRQCIRGDDSILPENARKLPPHPPPGSDVLEAPPVQPTVAADYANSYDVLPRNVGRLLAMANTARGVIGVAEDTWVVRAVALILASRATHDRELLSDWVADQRTFALALLYAHHFASTPGGWEHRLYNGPLSAASQDYLEAILERLATQDDRWRMGTHVPTGAEWHVLQSIVGLPLYLMVSHNAQPPPVVSSPSAPSIPPPLNLRRTPCLPFPVFPGPPLPLQQPSSVDSARLETAVYDSTDDILPQNTGELLLLATQTGDLNEIQSQTWILQAVKRITQHRRDAIPEAWSTPSPGREFLLAIQYAHLFASLPEDRDLQRGTGVHPVLDGHLASTGGQTHPPIYRSDIARSPNERRKLAPNIKQGPSLTDRNPGTVRHLVDRDAHSGTGPLRHGDDPASAACRLTDARRGPVFA